MRLLAALLMTVAVAIAALYYPLAVHLAVLITVIAAVLLAYLARVNPSVVSLRHAALGAGVMAFVAVIIAVLLIHGDLPLDVRNWLRGLTLAAVTLPAFYWLILLATGGFDER